MIKITFLGLISLLLSSVTFAADPLGVAVIFADGMVLQRQMNVPVWGTAQPGDTVKVTFGGQEKTATADEAGKWMVKLDPLKASAEGRTLLIASPATSNTTVFSTGRYRKHRPDCAAQRPRHLDRLLDGGSARRA